MHCRALCKGLGCYRAAWFWWINCFAVIADENDLQWVAQAIAEQSCVLCSHSSRCLSVLSAPFACFAIYFHRNLFSFREHPPKAARSPLLLCRMFSKSVTLYLSPKHKIPSPRLERCVKAGKPQLDWFIKLKRRHLLPRLWAAAVFLGLCYSNPESIGSFKFTNFSVLSAHHLSNQRTRIF